MEPTGPTNPENFDLFFTAWLNRQQALVEQLTGVTENDDESEQRHKELIGRVLSHYRHYFQVRENATKENIFLFLSPPWLTNLERTVLWFGEFKPSIIFRLLVASVADLSLDQSQELDEVKIETVRRERELTQAMAETQERIASPKILERVRQWGRFNDRERSEMEESVEEIARAMMGLMESADRLRGTTVEKVMEILKPIQMVRLLAAGTRYQLSIRNLGLERERM